MSNIHLVIPDPHAKPGHSNKRAEYLGHLINDVRPDAVVMLGDLFDMPSLSSYDRGKKSFIGRTYRADVDAGIDFNDRLWNVVRKSKKRMPRRYALIGNHEQRIDRTIEVQPELEGVISYDDLDLERYYDTIVHYEGATPGTIELDGITYGHYMVTGISGRPISGEHAAYTHLTKKFTSCVVGHSHSADLAIRTRPDGKKITGLVAGCYLDYDPEYAGNSADLWWRGVVVLRNVEDGCFDPQFVSLSALKKEYGTSWKGGPHAKPRG